MNDLTQLERFRHYLRLLASRQIGSRYKGKVDSSGIVQETMLQAHRAWSDLAKMDDAERLRYLRRILSNRVIDEVRRCDATRRGGGLNRSLRASVEGSSEQLDAALVAIQPSPPDAVEQSEQLMRVAKSLAELPADQQQAIELHCLDGLTIAETANAMSKTEPAIAGLVRRGLKTLRQKLNPRDEQSL